MVLLNVFREVGRYFVNQGGYYLTVAEFPGSQLVNRDAALVLIAWFHIAVGLWFRLELSSFDSELLTVGTVLLQNALEIACRLTAVERDSWTKRCLGRLCSSRAKRRSTRLVISVSPSKLAHGAQEAGPHQKTEQRTVEPAERLAVVREYNSRVVVVEMLSE